MLQWLAFYDGAVDLILRPHAYIVSALLTGPHSHSLVERINMEQGAEILFCILGLFSE